MSKSRSCWFFSTFEIGFAFVFAMDIMAIGLFILWIVGTSYVLYQTADYRLNGRTYSLYQNNALNYFL